MARQGWIRKLIDLSRRNNLLYYRSLKTGNLDLSSAEPGKMAALLSGETVSLGRLLPNGQEETTVSVMRNIARRAVANAEEKGLQTLFVALGMATWPSSDEGRPPDSPVLLFPVAVTNQGRGSQAFSLTRSGNVQMNLVLLHVLEDQYGIRIAADDLIPLLQDDEEGERFDPQPLFDELMRRASEVPSFVIKPAAILGNFAFQKMAMVKDLQEGATALGEHDVIAGIAGDQDAKQKAAAVNDDVDPKTLDSVPPENEFLVLDADSSQQSAISAVVAGQNAVIHGPPGTGKSQTITNLIASLAARGQKVLFVAEKRAALEVVLRRLKDVGLDHLAIDLHGADVSSKRVMEQIARTLDTVRGSPLVDSQKVHSQLVDRRSRLNSHADRLHIIRKPVEESVYQIQGTLLRLEHRVTSGTRWRGAELSRITCERARHISDLLVEAGGFATLFLRTDKSPWTGANLRDGAAVQRALDLVASLVAEAWPNFQEALASVIERSSLNRPNSSAQAKELFDLVASVQKTLSKYSADVFKLDLPHLSKSLGPAKSGGFASAWALFTRSDYRHARSLILEHRLDRHASAPELFAEIDAANHQQARWRELSNLSSLPCSIAGYDQWRPSFETFFQAASTLTSILPSKNINAVPLTEFPEILSSLAADSTTPHQLPKLLAIESDLESSGAGKIVSEIRKNQPVVKLWPLLFDYALHASSLDAACEEDPEVRGFRGPTHNGFVNEFIQLDEERIELAASRVRRAHAERAVAAMNANPNQQFLIRAEAQKKSRHMALRKVFAQASDVLTAVCPCWMASPLSVSQLLDAGKKYFDFVIFDEASQVLPEDAVPAILRGTHTVVAGDRNQLPPTTFFAATDDEEFGDDESAASEGFESLLDAMNAFLPSRFLDWHYRSRDEALIAFSNHHIYRDRLITFPGTGGPPVISHVLVDQELGADGQEESCSTEVRKVVELVLEHARKRPNETLGVIAMGIRHADRLQAALDDALEKHADLQNFFDPSKSERFFVKNLERVQGDERDAIMLSVGYGKDRAGNLPFRFGPLVSEGGRRRLNVAVTRARQRMTLVSSFSHLDMDLARVRKGSGVELLRDYLQYASSNGRRFAETEITNVAPNDFEAEVCDVLSARGLRLISQMGASHFRIDLVAEHPRKPGRYVLAIECDGATYHSSYTARDRDRLRQQQLEALGWRFCRIWSTDWFTRKDAEADRVVQAYEQAVAFADELDLSESNGNGNNHRNNTQNNHQNAAVASANSKRGPRPPIPRRTSIAQYSSRELVQLVAWINSDGQLRTDEEILPEMVAALGFSRRGARIDAAIRAAIRTWQAS